MTFTFQQRIHQPVVHGDGHGHGHAHAAGGNTGNVTAQQPQHPGQAAPEAQGPAAATTATPQAPGAPGAPQATPAPGAQVCVDLQMCKVLEMYAYMDWLCTSAVFYRCERFRTSNGNMGLLHFRTV